MSGGVPMAIIACVKPFRVESNCDWKHLTCPFTVQSIILITASNQEGISFVFTKRSLKPLSSLSNLLVPVSVACVGLSILIIASID